MALLYPPLRGWAIESSVRSPNNLKLQVELFVFLRSVVLVTTRGPRADISPSPELSKEAPVPTRRPGESPGSQICDRLILSYLLVDKSLTGGADYFQEEVPQLL